MTLVRKYRYLISDRKLSTQKEIERYILNECDSKYHGTYRMIQLWKQGYDSNGMKEMGLYSGQIGKFLSMSKIVKIEKEFRQGFVPVSLPDVMPPSVMVGAK